jgi:hypothetical protein
MAGISEIESPFLRRVIQQTAHQRRSGHKAHATRAMKATLWCGLITFVSVCAKLCSSYEVGSQALMQCMDSMGDRLSHGCIEALVQAGEISQREVDSRK